MQRYLMILCESETSAVNIQTHIVETSYPDNHRSPYRCYQDSEMTQLLDVHQKFLNLFIAL